MHFSVFLLLVIFIGSTWPRLTAAIIYVFTFLSRSKIFNKSRASWKQRPFCWKAFNRIDENSRCTLDVPRRGFSCVKSNGPSQLSLLFSEKKKSLCPSECAVIGCVVVQLEAQLRCWLVEEILASFVGTQSVIRSVITDCLRQLATRSHSATAVSSSTKEKYQTRNHLCKENESWNVGKDCLAIAAV